MLAVALFLAQEHWAFRPPVRPGPALHSIDRFLAPAPEADRPTLLRRLSFDLTGLPPTAEEQEVFAADTAPGAWERQVDRLLASESYGRRWGQHWLELARFAETDGFEHDKVRPEAWRYRDWVIDALNRDLPYDRFVALQIAADELEPAEVAATGFLLAGPDYPDINNQQERRHVKLNEMTSTVGAVFLGLTLHCAECHDHKFDPIPQADFYRLRAFFANTTWPQRDKALGTVVAERGPEPPAEAVPVRGDFRRPGEPVEPGVPRAVGGTPPGAEPTEHSCGRRRALAAWLTRPDHPLVGRVIVNWLWQHHFGVGIVATSGDFGLQGSKPTHPELLDWLATELPARGWSLKAMHRLMVTSAAYRRAAGRRHRLDGEAIRDAMLFAAGRLSPRCGGEGVRPPLPPEITRTLLKDQWNVSPQEEDHRRRSVYLFARRNLRYPIFELFDRPDSSASCPRRHRSTTAPQALHLLNSDFSLECARHLAGRVLADADPVGQAYRLALGRPPSDPERTNVAAFLRDQAGRLEGRAPETLALPEPLPAGADPRAAAALTDLCLALFNLNEFVYVD